MRCKNLLGSSLIILLLASGCHRSGKEKQSAPEEHTHGGVVQTVWTASTEAFVEYPPLVAGQEAAFAIHITNLHTFRPVEQGRLTCELYAGGEVAARATLLGPNRPGIFEVRLTPPHAGDYALHFRLAARQAADTIVVDNITVHADAETAHLEVEAVEAQEQTISFLKEQQWELDFRSDPAQKRALSPSVFAVGEILPQVNRHAQVTSAVNGIILPEYNRTLPEPGQLSRKGEVLVVISPHANSGNHAQKLRSDYLLARANYERARELHQQRLISEAEFQAIQLNYQSLRAGFEILEQQSATTLADVENGTAVMNFQLKSPIDGVIQNVHFHLGKTVEAGDPLYTITDTRRVLLLARVALAHAGKLADIRDASFRVEGYHQELGVGERGGKLISVGSLVDGVSRTIPVLFEVGNSDRLLKIGMRAEVNLKGEARLETVAIPASAILDEDGSPIAFVQIGGETFVRRRLKTGIVDRGIVQIIAGIDEGERVVTSEAYQVKLASMSTAVPTGHGHEH